MGEFLHSRTSTLDHVMALLAAAIHDVGHTGNNNNFLCTTQSALALRYNDQSVLENMHVSLSFEFLMTDPYSNWFHLLPGRASPQGGSPTQVINLQQYVRRGLIKMVLATDMAKHSSHVSDLANFSKDGCAPGEEAQDHKTQKLGTKLFLLGALVHGADISNPCKPRRIMLQWTQRVLNEFWDQGDEEARLGLPISPLSDRVAGRATVPKGQMDFIHFVIRPYWSTIGLLTNEAQVAVDTLQENYTYWERKHQEKATLDQIFT